MVVKEREILSERTFSIDMSDRDDEMKGKKYVGLNRSKNLVYKRFFVRIKATITS